MIYEMYVNNLFPKGLNNEIQARRKELTKNNKEIDEKSLPKISRKIIKDLFNEWINETSYHKRDFDSLIIDLRRDEINLSNFHRWNDRLKFLIQVRDSK